jgi:DNA topoisomerase-1
MKINNENVAFGSEGEVRPHLDILERSQYTVTDVKRGTRQRRPSAPFTTSTLQQEASRRLGFTARRTMRVAQQLYEGIDMGDGSPDGLITYMRTDSTAVSTLAQKTAREFIGQRFGKDYVPAKPPKYQTRAKGAQEAHEAVRPTSVLREPKAIRTLLSTDQFKLYRLIWERFVASQMANAIYDTVRVDIAAGPSRDEMPYTFRVTGQSIRFNGFLALYEDSRDEDESNNNQESTVPPDLTVDEILDLVQLLPEQHFTQPPPRYTEASLVRTLEEYGIGRPSTYAPTVAVIQDRDYVNKQDKRLLPTDTGKVVNDLLVEFFPDVLDYQFTARMEDQLDNVAQGESEWQPMLHEFYTPFSQQLNNARSNMPTMRQEEFVGRDCPETGHPLVIRYGRWGKFIGCSDYPDCRYTEPYIELTGVVCPQCGEEHGGELVVRKTRRGRTFFGCMRYPDCDYSTWKLPKQEKSTPTEDPEPEENPQPDYLTG